MNLKKITAALAAAAMAVSAMATVVAAEFTPQTLTYSLVSKQEGSKPVGGSATIYAVVPDGTVGELVIGEITRYVGSTDFDRETALDVKYVTKGTNPRSNRLLDITISGGLYVLSLDAGDSLAAVEFKIEVEFENFTSEAMLKGYLDATGITDDIVNYVVEDFKEAGTEEFDINFPLATNREGVLGFGWGYGDGTNDAWAVLVNDYALNLGSLKGGAFGNGVVGLNGSSVLTDGQTRGKGENYTRPMAVINDGLQNYPVMTITFNTAKNEVCEVCGAYQNAECDEDGQGDHNDYTDEYLAFSWHLYANRSGDDGVRFGYNAYEAHNFMNSAIVINNSYTLSFHDVNSVTYNATSVTFDISGMRTLGGHVASEGTTLAAVQQYLWQLDLATSTLWFWDSMDVTVGGEDAQVDADIAADDDVIDLDDSVIVLDDDDVITLDDEDVVVVDTVPTGNASAALAIVPVALAAAAIMIKRRK